VAGGTDEGVGLTMQRGAHTIHRLGHLIGGMTRNILPQCRAEHLASGPSRAAGEPLGLLEHIVWNGDRRFHTRSITAQERGSKQQSVVGVRQVVRRQGNSTQEFSENLRPIRLLERLEFFQ
jgi:hypothetical protein